MRHSLRRAGVAGLILCVLAPALPSAAAMTTCRIRYKVSGWSFLYKTYTGSGIVHCENGESARVGIETHEGGFSFGKSEIEGRGVFTAVRGVHEVYGTYVDAGAHAGLTRSAAGSVMTRGEVSLSIAGTGRGVDLGFAFGAFRIEAPRR